MLMQTIVGRQQAYCDAVAVTWRTSAPSNARRFLPVALHLCYFPDHTSLVKSIEHYNLIVKVRNCKVNRISSQAYWPFHKSACYRNEFADLTEASEPKFARWMRKHQKLAVLKDDEVDRLERASAACTGPSREEVMDSIYNRLDPKPRGKSLFTQLHISANFILHHENLQDRLFAIRVCSFLLQQTCRRARMSQSRRHMYALTFADPILCALQLLPTRQKSGAQ